MAVNNSIYFRCPRCEHSIEVQVSTGKHGLMSIDTDNVPWDIVEHILNQTVWCDGCGRESKVTYRPRPPGASLMLQET